MRTMGLAVISKVSNSEFLDNTKKDVSKTKIVVVIVTLRIVIF